jgi:hypothetical protein
VTSFCRRCRPGTIKATIREKMHASEKEAQPHKPHRNLMTYVTQFTLC